MVNTMTCHEIEKYSVHEESIGAKKKVGLNIFTISIITVCIHTPYLVFFFLRSARLLSQSQKLLPKI